MCAPCIRDTSARKMIACTCTSLYNIYCARARILYKLRIYFFNMGGYTNNNKKR